MFRKSFVLAIFVASLCAEESNPFPQPPVVSDALRADAYKALANLTAVKLALTQAQVQMPDAQKAFDAAQKALMEACGADFQMDQEALKQENFVCVAKPAPQQPPRPTPAKPEPK